MTEQPVESYVEAVSIVNERLSIALQEEEPDTMHIRQLVDERDALVTSCLEKLSGEQLTSFAQQEYEFNQKFVEKTQSLFKQSLSSLSKFVKDAKAVRKYR